MLRLILTMLSSLLPLLLKSVEKEVKENKPKKPEPEPTKEEEMSLSDDGLKLLVESEGFRSKPYLDTRGIPTIGYGSTFYEDNTKVTMNDKEISKERALELKKFVLGKFEEEIKKLVKVKLNQNQYDAIVNLVYNIGTGAFSTSTLLKKLNAEDYQGAADQFLVWKRAGNDPDILLPRRRKERELFLKSI